MASSNKDFIEVIMGEYSAKTFSLKMLVAKEENKVIMAESDKDFIEVLFSFMLMPIASVVRNTRKWLRGDIGCLNNLYGSVENLKTDYFEDKMFQNMLLRPRSAADIHCQNLKLNLIGSGCFYVCENVNCRVISCYNIGNCQCGFELKNKLNISPHERLFPEEEDSFLKPTARFIITDEIKVMAVADMADLTVLTELEKYGKIEERVIRIGEIEVLKLLKRSLTSRTSLSDTFLKPTNNSREPLCMKYGPEGMNRSLNVKDFGIKIWSNIHIKLIFDKVNNVALYAVVKEDFVNFLCGILTIPLGYIFNRFPLLSFSGCLGNLHKSIQGTDISLFSCKKRKQILINPKLAPGLPYSSNLIAIEEANIASECSKLESSISKCRYNSSTPNRRKAYLKEPATFLVMDNLEVKPLSPISVKLLLDKMMVPLSDICEKEMILDGDKALRLLVASLASEHALTTTFLSKNEHLNCDCLDFLQLIWGGKRTGLKGC
ncbi:uncharacterized protein [Rutidosis leptorrhynchoides]|uniref:uncharacterized protein n=1 Tax=Rutidosis leptorrhynchoides TaxID=125765 RepID=UPI003A99DB32